MLDLLPTDMKDRELDMIQLSVLVFLPAAFAFLLLVVPAGWKSFMRWWTVFGTALTLTLGLVYARRLP